MGLKTSAETLAGALLTMKRLHRLGETGPFRRAESG